jgi:outer membrane protein assembly factor BamB
MTGPRDGWVNVCRHLLLSIFAAAICLSAAAQRASGDWPQFGWDLVSSSAPTYTTGITAANIDKLTRRQVTLDGTVDSAAIYLRGVTVKGSKHDVFFVTTTYGKTIAVDAAQGTILWEYTPPKYDTLHGTAQITNSSPVADPDRESIYAAAPDGTVQKLAISDGHVLWATAVTMMPLREKIAGALREFHGHIIVVTGGYVGDRPPYQGHVVILDAKTGQMQHVWYSLCGDRTALYMPNTCPDSDSAIWGRAGAVIDASGNIFLATGNGPYDGKTNWGDAVIELNPDATRIIGNYTPANNAELNRRDLDVGSTSPAMLGGDLIAQGGKDGVFWLISIKAMAGSASHMGGELQTVPTPSGARQFPTAPAVWHHGADTWLFAADFGATAAWTLKDGKLVPMWKNSNAGTSPVVAGGLLYVYDAGGGMHIYDAVKGTQSAELACGSGHWNSPIVVDGRIALPEGNANMHATSGLLDIWSVPGR